jgi:DNA-binding CsgD family transcriptional regulator
VRATRSTATIPFGPFASWVRDRRVGSPDRLGVLREIGRELLAGDAHVLVAVDDAHLLDDGSAALVLHLATDTPASVVVTVRAAVPCPDAVESLWKEGVAERIDLQPLSEPETAELLEQVLGGPIDRSARRRLFVLTEGAPLYLREVVRAGLDQGVLVRDDGTWGWKGKLAGSDRLVSLIGDHMSQARGDERRIVEMVALGEPIPLDVIGQLAATSALITAEAHGFVVADDAASPAVVRLAHPLYGEVLRSGMPTLTGREHLRGLATAAVAVGWQEQDPLRVASWWLGSGATSGDPQLLLTAADRAVVLSEWALADRLAQAAAASGAGARATLIRASALVPLGRLDDAEALLTELCSGDIDDDTTADAVSIRASLLFWRRGRSGEARSLLTQATARLSGRAHARVAVYGSQLALQAGEPHEAVRLATDGIATAGSDGALRVQALASQALALAFQARTSETLAATAEALPYVESGLDSNPHPGWAPANVLPAYCVALSLQGRFAEAAAAAESEMARLRRDDPPALRGVAASVTAWVALRQGRPDRARQLAREALDLSQEVDQYPTSVWIAAILVAAAAQMGDTSERDELERAAAASPTPRLTESETRLARAWLAASRGELSAARAIAERAAADAASCGLTAYEMLALIDLVRLGAPESAAPRLAELTLIIEGAYAPAAASYARALVADDATALDEASTRFECMGSLLLAAESAAAAAAAHLRAGGRGSHLTSLGRARTLAARCDGPRTPALRDIHAVPVLATLTDREREVLELAARGYPNREIASRLYVSIRTVHTHLYRAYAKLGVSDREQLAPLVLGADAPVVPHKHPTAPT